MRLARGFSLVQNFVSKKGSRPDLDSPHNLKKKVVCALVQAGRYRGAVAPLATSRLLVQIPADGSGLPEGRNAEPCQTVDRQRGLVRNSKECVRDLYHLWLRPGWSYFR